MILRDAIEVQAGAAAIFEFFERIDEHYVPLHPDHRLFRWTRGHGLAIGHRFYFEEFIAGKLLKKEVEYTGIEPGHLIEFAPVHQPLRWFLPRLLFRIEPIREGLSRLVAEIHLRVGPLGEWLNRREFDAVREHMRVEGVNVKRIVEAFVATGCWPAPDSKVAPGGRDNHDTIDLPALRALRASSEVQEARVQRLTDEQCLAHQLLWLGRTAWVLPVDALWVALAIHAGLSWTPIAAWIVARASMHAASRLWSRRLRPWIERDPARGLAITRRVYAAFGFTMALLFPAFFIGTDDLVKLLAMLLASSYYSTVVVSASGQPRTYWWTVGPATAVMLAGWALRGGWLGWLIVAIVLLAIPIQMVTMRQQRRTWEDLVRLHDDKQRLAQSLAAERDRAQAASDARTRFFAAASHDLRQPLHALAINATTLELLAARAGDPRLAQISHGIGRSLAQSQGLLDALLDISRLDAGAVKLHLSEVDVGGLLRALHAEFASVAAQRALSFTLDLPAAPALALTDADQLQRVLRNLLDNAFKFTADGGVRLALQQRQAPGGTAELCLAVADTGCGIAESDREKVFEEFFQLGNPTRDRSHGLGLGLAIVRRTATLLGIQVRLRSGAAGRGSVFELLLPALPGAVWSPPVAARAAQEVDAGSGSPLSVLLVDDETDILQALAELLGTHGWQAHTAAGIDESLALAADRRIAIDVAVVDHRLPGGDGIALVQRLRALRPQLPALVVTGDVAVQWQVQRHGLQVLHKPLDGNALLQAIAAEAAASARWASRLHAFVNSTGDPPMNLIDAIHGRRSVREYSAEGVDHEVVKDLIWHASQVPRPPISNDESWAFHIIAGADRLADFGVRAKRYAAEHQPPGEPWTWTQRGDFEVFWGAPLAVLMCARQGHPEAPFDCCRAGQNLSLLAHARGLASCWLGSALPWLNSEAGRSAAGVPAGYDVAVAMVIGHAAEVMPGRSGPRPELTWCV